MDRFKPHQDAGVAERFGLALDRVRFFLFRAWKIAVLMVKGAYLAQERRRLLENIGTRYYSGAREGLWNHPELESMIHQLDRLTKKIEIEEMLIRGLRSGTKAGRKGDSQERASEAT